MKISITERRQIENEMIFRRLNEKVGKELEDLDALHLADNNLELMWDDAILLNFRCECSDEKCEQRIPVRLSIYKKIHENRSAFIVKTNHDVKSIEKVILKEDDYSVVLKNNAVPEPGDELNITNLENA